MLNQLKDVIVGIKGESTYTWKLDNPENKKFVEAIKAKWDGLPPMPEHQNAYALTKAILAGLEKTGGDDTLAKLFAAITSSEINTPAGPAQVGPERRGHLPDVRDDRREGRRQLRDLGSARHGAGSPRRTACQVSRPED